MNTWVTEGESFCSLTWQISRSILTINMPLLSSVLEILCLAESKTLKIHISNSLKKKKKVI